MQPGTAGQEWCATGVEFSNGTKLDGSALRLILPESYNSATKVPALDSLSFLRPRRAEHPRLEL